MIDSTAALESEVMGDGAGIRSQSRSYIRNRQGVSKPFEQNGELLYFSKMKRF
jgi:hypothetical protein